MNSGTPPALLRLTPAQSLLWIDGQLHPGVPLNNMVTRLDIPQALDIIAFQRAFSTLVQRHDAMRLRASSDGQQYLATIADEQSDQLPFLDYSSEHDKEQKLESWMNKRCRRVFQLNELLYEAALIKLADAEFVFFMTQHHCVTDGRSCQVMLADLDHLYQQELAAGECSHARGNQSTPSYADYLVAQADYLGREEARASEGYWNARYKDAPDPVRFYGRSADVKSLTTARHATVLPKSLADKLLAARQETPPSLVFATVLFAFLRRATGNNDLCIGVPLLNRSPEYADTLGLFMSICRNRLTVSNEDSFATLLEKIRAEAASIKPHRAHTITSRNARYEAMLNYRVPADTSFAGKEARLLRIPPIALLDTPADEEPTDQWAGRDSLEVDITHTPANGEFYLALDFNTGVWPDPLSRERSMTHFLKLLTHFFDNHHKPIDELDILGDAEGELMRRWNETSAPCPYDNGVHGLFEARAASAPDAIAIEYCGREVSYSQLDNQANRLAHALIAQGIDSSKLVAISLPRSFQLVVALLATLKAGAAYVPLDPNYPQHRRQLILDEAGVDLLLTEQTIADLLSNETREHNPGLACRPDTLAYVIYTSGSTGRPKGVMIEQGALLNFLQSAQQVLQFNDRHRLLSVTTVAFDIFALELYLPLTQGARVVLASAEQATDGRLLAQAINGRNITHLQATPATWHMLLDADWQPDHPLEGLVGGELLTGDLAARLRPRCSRLRNWYGPTEATIWATQLVVEDNYQPGDIGSPLANYSVHVLDAQGTPAPIGVTGELCVGGQSLARGYLHRDELTRKAFTEIDGLGRVYRTGDLARWTGQGHIEFLGRSDFQVKIRGFRIELGDIESALLTHPEVTEAVVIDFGNDENRQLAAYVRPQLSGTGKAGSEDALVWSIQAHLQQHLPHYMLPATITVLARLPLTPNGKVDRKALPDPQPTSGDSQDSLTAPHTPLQRTLAAIWAETLGLEQVGIQDSFFDLGGHSLMAMRLLANIERDTGISLRLPEFFQNPTIENICASAARQAEAGPDSALVALRASGNRPPFFAIGSHPRYADAVERIDAQQPVYRFDVYALLSERIDGGMGSQSSIEAIAREFIDTIQSVQPHGPYFIGGGCEGAMIAFAAATELQRRGERVEQLTLWITPAPGYARGNIFGIPASRRMVRQFRSLSRHLGMADLNLRTLREVVRHEYIEYRIFRAMDSFQPARRYRGRIALARTAQSRGSWDTDPHLGWAQLASEGVETHTLPGDHDTWLIDHAEAFGDLLDHCLRAPG